MPITNNNGGLASQPLTRLSATLSPSDGEREGYLTGGIGNRSAWFVESMAQVGQPRPVVLGNDGALGFRTNAFGFNVGALVGQTVVIEGSTDLLNWVRLATIVFGATPQYFTDPAAPGFARRFYRAIAQ
jgi:hypothetical protein